MRRRVWVSVWLAVWACAAVAHAAAAPVREGDLDVLYLDALADPARWGPSECTLAAEAADRLADGRPTLGVHIPVDYQAGEAKYPIGWPRMYVKLVSPDETGWAAFDRFEFQVYTAMSRPQLPRRPLNFQIHCPAKPDITNRSLTELALGRWVRISVAVDQVPNVGKVTQLGFNISESDYRDGDVLDLRIGGFRLVRAAVCRVAEWTACLPAVYQGTPELRMQASVAGPPEAVADGLPVVIRRGDTTVGQLTVAIQRGRQVLRLPVADLALTPGDYAVTAFDTDATRRVTAAVRVVSSPWPAP